MVKINLYGNIFDTSGYALHTRNLLNALLDLGADVKLEVPLFQGWEGLVSDQELQAIKKSHHNDGATIIINTPPYWPLAKIEPHKGFFGFVIWEGTHVPEGWHTELLLADGIFVPSNHVKDAILRTFPRWILQDKIHIVSHGVDTALFQPSEVPSPERPFTFVGNKGWSQGLMDRGGLQFLLKAFFEEFTPGEPVLLRLKINTAYNPPGWDLGNELRKLGIPEGRKQLMICTDKIASRAMPGIYQGNVFVSPSMGEAFNIPCLEAMSCGLPVITTGFGGQNDYVNEYNGWLIDYDLFEVEHDLLYEGNSWGRPRLDHLKSLLRYAFEHPSECAAKGIVAHSIAQSFTWQHSAKQVLQLLEGWSTL